jgi:hypothetical protein
VNNTFETSISITPERIGEVFKGLTIKSATPISDGSIVFTFEQMLSPAIVLTPIVAPDCLKIVQEDKKLAMHIKIEFPSIIEATI